MTNTTVLPWEAKRTDETRLVEETLRRGGFATVDAYRYNSASIRLRVIDPRFEGLPIEKRDAMVEPYLDSLPERTQSDIMTLFTFAPSELKESPKAVRERLLNMEFESPSPSIL
jgi:hypothetical protein